jgi:flagellar biosynthesis/type III secretory pathway ATPase
MLPRLLERTGNDAHGSITALYTVLVAGGDMDEPIADEVRGILDGHIVLSRALADRGQYPPVDVLASVSRVMPQVTSASHHAAAGRVREALGEAREVEDLVRIGAYVAGSDQKADWALAHLPAIQGFLRQGVDECSPFTRTVAELEALWRTTDGPGAQSKRGKT